MRSIQIKGVEMKAVLDPNDDKKVQMNIQGGSPDTVYGIGLIGAWVYYFRRATTFNEYAKAFFKGFAWPAILVYRLFEFLDRE